MVADSKISEKQDQQVRDETLALNKIDTDYLEKLIEDQLDRFKNSHENYFDQRREWILALRDLRYQYREGYFEQAADIHVPYTLIMAKAMHAKIFQVFSQQNFFSTEANNAAFEESEELVTLFMNWVMEKWTNRGLGKSDTIDAWISDIIDEGSGVLKLTWDRWQHNFLDFDIETEEAVSEELFPQGEDGEDVEVEEEVEIKARIKNVKKKLNQSAPRMGVIDLDDFYMPPGFKNVHEAPWVAHQVFLRDEDLKLRAQQKKFDKSVVEDCIEFRRSSLRNDEGRDVRQDLRDLEGVSRQHEETPSPNETGHHTILEWYGRAYVEKEVDDDTFKDIKTLPEEIVVWYHVDARKILGWTYLHRVSPSGRRPFYKADFMPSKERAFGIGVGELLWSLNNHIDAMHNIKLDNGVLSSLQFGIYRAGSTFKPETFRIRPGDMIPVEDVNDFRFTQVPNLGQFGENEELSLTGYGEKLLAINDINLGNLTGRGVAGALRNATGASFVDRQASIQMHPHLDRIARELKRFLSDMFVLARSRMNDQLFFRVTGEDGQGLFRNVKKEDLRGDFDFTIRVDLAASSESERQQRVSLMLQTLLNPTFMQLGLVQPGNLYEVVKEFLIRHQIKVPDKFITKPPQYTGAPLSPEQRILKIMTGQSENPPIEQTIRPEENHAIALEVYTKFQQSQLFGTFGPTQIAALQEVIEQHQKFQALTEGAGQGVPNIAGTQFPGTGGLGAIGPQGGGPAAVPEAGASEGGPLGSPLGEVNGPVQ